MSINIREKSEVTQEGDLVQLVGSKSSAFITKLTKGNEFQSHQGVIKHQDLIGIVWGSRVKTHTGKLFIVLQPALDDLLRDIPRDTQIMYPKDIGYILLTMGIGPGSKVIEAGSGSGAFTAALAYTVGEKGKIISYENRQKHIDTARQNLEKFGLDGQVEFKLHDIKDGFDEKNIGSIFLDLPDSHLYIQSVRNALIPGGFFGCLIPTTNQVSEMITALKQHNLEFVEISEILHRYYKVSATRFRPVDRMVAHTGFLVFARKVSYLKEIS